MEWNVMLKLCSQRILSVYRYFFRDFQNLTFFVKAFVSEHNFFRCEKALRESIKHKEGLLNISKACLACLMESKQGKEFNSLYGKDKRGN